MEVKIDSPDPENIAGEIICKGTNLMLGYYKNTGATSQIIDVNGWLHTGDLATMDSEGYVTVRGRSKNMLLTSSGQNIYPEEIESKFNNMPYVSESLVLLQKDKLVALIYPDFDDAFAHGLLQSDIEKIMETNRIELNQQLPAYCQITKIKIHFEEFEKTAKKSIKRFMYQEAKDKRIKEPIPRTTSPMFPLNCQNSQHEVLRSECRNYDGLSTNENVPELPV